MDGQGECVRSESERDLGYLIESGHKGDNQAAPRLVKDARA